MPKPSLPPQPAAASTVAFQTAGLGRRLTGMVYDSMLLAGVLFVGLLLPHTLIGVFTQKLAQPVLLQAHFFLLLLIYFAWFWLHGGQTLAMKTWHVRLVSADGGPVRPLQALLRYLLAWPSLCLGGFGLFWQFWDADRQFLHDRLAGTRLIDTRFPA